MCILIRSSIQAKQTDAERKSERMLGRRADALGLAIEWTTEIKSSHAVSCYIEGSPGIANTPRWFLGVLGDMKDEAKVLG